MTEASGARHHDAGATPAETSQPGTGDAEVRSPGASPPARPAGESGGSVLALRGIRKVYGATVAVDELTVALEPARVHALVGENGAGKSTAAQIAAGVTRPTAGHVEFAGQEVAFGSARDAEALGIVLIPQELQLYESLSVAENMYVGLRGPGVAAAWSRGTPCASAPPSSWPGWA